jgi:hypothetical protein|nr:MAG TPA: hypothetical protein [Caudoviricetes sp.]DAP20643.1 MAG TPA: hypothetical protein [Caudoviricetes sp.]
MMKKIKDCAVAFFNKHFVKWKFLQSILIIPFIKDGKMYLHVSQVCGGGPRVVKRTFLIEHLVDNNLAVTNQTLEEEKRVFKNPTLL